MELFVNSCRHRERSISQKLCIEEECDDGLKASQMHEKLIYSLNVIHKTKSDLSSELHNYCGKEEAAAVAAKHCEEQKCRC